MYFHYFQTCETTTLLRCLRGLTLQFSLETPWGYHSRVMGLWQLMNVMKDINRTSLIIDECYGGALPQMQIHHIVFAFLGNGWIWNPFMDPRLNFILYYFVFLRNSTLTDFHKWHIFCICPPSIPPPFPWCIVVLYSLKRSTWNG